ncbi:unnamed protein product [Didymodactylos carnosus]|uniref:Uncharacterized protein n=1 Tax=Didymodactylos carnosus TaxID=1234261 RepID=A0A8S2PZV0_9BILA|nr:unnamed protein product [Didymodactylos carnosus]CAF4073342.1 unnamed protein product [Didymodactylos carnosus]
MENDILHNEFMKQKRRVGAPSYHEQIPELVQAAQNVLELNAIGADDRRRTDEVRYNGLSTKELKAATINHLKDQYPQIKNISESTIRRLMLPPCSNRKAAIYYKPKIIGKVVSKRNSRPSSINKDSHFASAQVKYCRELAALYPDEIVDFSCDNKAKVHVGTLAVSYHQIRKYHLLKYAPNYDDHDFPDSAKLTPSVYLEIKHQPRRCRNTYYKSTSQMHIKHLENILEQIRLVGKAVCIITLDNGPDWSHKCGGNIFNFGTLWED